MTRLVAPGAEQPGQKILVFPSPAPVDVARTLDLAGYCWKAVSGGEEATKHEPMDGWAGAVGCATTTQKAHGHCADRFANEPFLLATCWS